MISFSSLHIKAETENAKLAADILLDEIAARTGSDKLSPEYTVIFEESTDCCSDDFFSIKTDAEKTVFTASGIRGFIFAIGMLLRKCIVKENRIFLPYDISGEYAPEKKIRGHQVGYRQTPNTYDAWDIPEYKRYYIDMMFFGTNTCEHIPYENGYSNRNAIMRRDEQDLLIEAAREAKKLGMDVSVWYPNCENDIETAIENREKLFSATRDIDYVFPPGGDPGDLAPEEFFKRCKAIRQILKKYIPEGEMWPSAQQPHNFPDWGTRFLALINDNPDYIDGIITGPNEAFPLDELRQRVPARYPIRFYPDITHNLRCQYPVHFDRDDWNYALAAVNSRECTNPRPSEYKRIHSMTKGYVVGSVSYSEGITDDINKAVWAALDFDSSTPVREILEDYSRLFFPGADFTKAADAIFGLEMNWEGAPEENPCIESTLRAWEEIGDETPTLKNNWRYIQCLFRARCDAFIRRKMLFENDLINKAKRIAASDISKAKDILCTPLPQNITVLREQLEEDGRKLFELIGLQLDVERYYARNPERGAVLDTIKLPITDLPWLLNCYQKAEALPEGAKKAYINRCFNRNRVESDEYYYSVALDGICPGGVTQSSGFYMNVQGDRPEKNNGTLPTSLFKLFDHFSFRLKAGGLRYDTDYTMMITYRNLNNEDSISHTVRINENTVFSGQQFGGRRNVDYEKDMLTDGFIAVEYTVPADFIINGCIELEITEPVNGFEIAELRLTKKPYKSYGEE